MNVEKILITEPEDFPTQALETLKKLGEVSFGPFTQDELIKKVSGVSVLYVRLGHAIDANVLNAAPNLKTIVTATTGLNHIDTQLAESRGIKILSLRGESEFLETISPTADLTFGLILSLTRHIHTASQDVLSGNWNRDAFKGIDLKGRTLGIYGLGRIGRKVAKMGLAFDMKVIAYDIDPEGRMEGVDIVSETHLLKTADILSMHVLHHPELDGFFNAEKFAAMKDGSYFINTARGELVDENALLTALQNHKLAGAALDVISDEQNKKSHHPLITYAQQHHNLLITPHIGGASIDSMQRVELFMAQKLLSVMRAS